MFDLLDHGRFEPVGVLLEAGRVADKGAVVPQQRGPLARIIPRRIHLFYAAAELGKAHRRRTGELTHLPVDRGVAEILTPGHAQTAHTTRALRDKIAWRAIERYRIARIG